MCIWTHAHTLCHMLLHCTCCSLHDCVWQQWSGTLNCCIMLVHHVTIYTYSLSDTHKHITLTYGQKGTCIIETSLQWKDMTSISFQMTVVIIRFSSPHHLYLHHLAPIPGSHIRIFETNTHTHTHMNTYYYLHWYWKGKCTADAHAKNRNIHIHTRPPSCHRAKPSACPTLPLRMFWTSAVKWFPQWCRFVCLCVLFVPWWVEGIEAEGGRPIGLLLIP